MTAITTQLDTTEAVRLAAEALWVTEHYPVDENDMRLPSADHPDFVRMEVMTHPSVKAAVTAALPALAEQFASLIEARCLTDHGWFRHVIDGSTLVCPGCRPIARAVRLVRGGQS